MYFLTEEERKQLLKGYLPKSREAGVAEELRGWNWHQPPLQPVYDQSLALYEVANSYCPINRDLFLRRVQKIKTRPNLAMLKGIIFHAAMVDIIVSAKRLIYQTGVVDYRDIFRGLNELKPFSVEFYEKDMSEKDAADIQKKVDIISDFEKSRIVARIQEILIKQPYIGEDSLVNLAVPVVVEQKLDGSFLGLSQNLSADAFVFSEPMILDLKFGEPRKFHRLTTTGYALVMEAIYEFPVNLGCLVFAEFRENRLILKKDIHIIDDELRQWFIEERDDKSRMVYEEIDPGLAGDCYRTCPYFGVCRP